MLQPTTTPQYVAPCQAAGRVLLGNCPTCPHYNLAWDLCSLLQPQYLATDWRTRWDFVKI